MHTHLFTIVLWICSLSDTVGLTCYDSLLSKHFSQREVAQLDTIRTSFNNHVFNTCENGTTIDVCYQQFFDRLLADIRSQVEYKVSIPYDRQKRLYEQIDKDLFNSIWRPSNPKIYAPSVDSLVGYSTIDLYGQGSRYVDFVKDIAKNEPYFAKYLRPIIDVGALPPMLTQGLLYNRSGLDFSNECHQLILAIHFLTVNDQQANQPE